MSRYVSLNLGRVTRQLKSSGNNHHVMSWVGVTKRLQSSQSGYKAPAREVNLAYDAAVDYLESFTKSKLERVKQVEKELETVKGDSEKLKELEKLKYELLVESKRYSPATDWEFLNGQFNKEEPVFHYLLEQEWVELNRPVLEQRLTQMHVTPDVLPPNATLEAQLNVTYPTNTEGSTEVNPGTKLTPEEVQTCPQVEVSVFHRETRYYSLLLVDPDSPAPEVKNYTEKPHWAVCNIPLSYSAGKVDLTKSGSIVLPYLPPHPQQGTASHRYTLVLLEQSQPKLDPSVFQATLAQPGTTVRTLLDSMKFQVRGAHFFRSSWSNFVSSFYKDTLNLPEPIFGPQPTVNPRVGPDGRVRNRYLNA